MKKVLSLVLAVVLVLGMSATAFAAINNPKDIVLTDITMGLGVSGAGGTDINSGDINPGQVYDLYLVVGGKNITRQDVRDLKLDVQLRAVEGSSLVKSAKIVNKTLPGTKTQVAVVELKMVDEFVSTKEQNFDIQLYLTSDKKRIASQNEYTARVSGTMENLYTEVDEYDDKVYVADYPVVKALDYIRNITVDMGQGISIQAKMFDGKNYYAKVSQEIKTEDEAVIAKYPDIQTVYYLKTIGLSSTGDVVSFYDLSDNFYVYVQNADGDLVYVGRTNEKLPYFTKYFLSAKELEVDATIGEGGDDVEPEPGPEAGGDDAPANINDNPSTGR